MAFDETTPLTPFEDLLNGVVAELNARIQTGKETVTPVANTPTALTVNFPTPFAAIPNVFVTADSGVPGSTVIEVAVQAVTTTNFRIVVYRTNGTNTIVNWLAVLP